MMSCILWEVLWQLPRVLPLLFLSSLLFFFGRFWVCLLCLVLCNFEMVSGYDQFFDVLVFWAHMKCKINIA